MFLSVITKIVEERLHAHFTEKAASAGIIRLNIFNHKNKFYPQFSDVENITPF